MGIYFWFGLGFFITVIHAFIFCLLSLIVPDGSVENLVYQNISSSSVNVSWLPPSQPNGLVFFHVSLSLLQLGTHKILSFLTYNTSIVFDNLEKYTDYILKITPATDKGSSELHALSLHIKTDEDGKICYSYLTTCRKNKQTTNSFLKEKYIVVFILQLFLLYKDTNYCHTFLCLDHETEFSTQSTALTDN